MQLVGEVDVEVYLRFAGVDALLSSHRGRSSVHAAAAAAAVIRVVWWLGLV